MKFKVIISLKLSYRDENFFKNYLDCYIQEERVSISQDIWLKE